MAELDVIERMLAAYSAVAERNLAERGSFGQDQAMLAAVRELRDLLDLEGGNPTLLPGTDANQAYDASNVIERIILEHERRAGGKGE